MPLVRVAGSCAQGAGCSQILPESLPVKSAGADTAVLRTSDAQCS